MGRGGKRAGAGRKPGIPNTLTRELREKIKALRLIEELQAIIFKGKGNPTTSERINAIKLLLNKIMPDVNRIDIVDEEIREAQNYLSDEQAKKVAESALKAIEIRQKRREQYRIAANKKSSKLPY